MPFSNLLANAFPRPGDGISLAVEQLIDLFNQRHIVWPVIAAVAAAFQRPKLGKARFPEAQDMLMYAQPG